MSESSSEQALPDSRVARAHGILSHVQNAALLAIAYFAIAGLGHSLSPGDEAAGFFWLPAGLLLATFLLTSHAEWPWLAAGALVGDAAFGFAHGLAPAAIAIRVGVTLLQALLAAELVERLVSRPFRLESVRHLVMFVLAAVVVATLAGSLVAIEIGGTSGMSFRDALWSRWASNAMGVLVLTPLVLQWADLPEDRSGRVRLRHPVEAALLVATAVASIGYVFGYWDRTLPPARLVLMIPVVWAALRFGLHGVTAVLFVEALPIAFTSSIAARPLHAASPIAIAQLFLAMRALIGLGLAVFRSERGRR